MSTKRNKKIPSTEPSLLTSENLKQYTEQYTVHPPPLMRQHSVESVRTIMSATSTELNDLIYSHPTLMEQIKAKIALIMERTIIPIMNASFDSRYYQFEYDITIDPRYDSLKLYMKINDLRIKIEDDSKETNENDSEEEMTDLIGTIIQNDDERTYYSKIDYVRSHLTCKTGNFLVYIFTYILIKIKSISIKLENCTNCPERAAVGIYNMFVAVDDEDKSLMTNKKINDVYKKLKEKYEIYDHIDPNDISTLNTLRQNIIFMKYVTEYPRKMFNEIPEKDRYLMALSHIFRTNDAMMAYKIQKKSLPEIQNKIIELLTSVDESRDKWTCVPWKSELRELLPKLKFKKGNLEPAESLEPTSSRKNARSSEPSEPTSSRKKARRSEPPSEPPLGLPSELPSEPPSEPRRSERIKSGQSRKKGGKKSKINKLKKEKRKTKKYKK